MLSIESQSSLTVNPKSPENSATALAQPPGDAAYSASLQYGPKPLTSRENSASKLKRRRTRTQRIKRIVRRMWIWMSPIRIWRELCKDQTARRDFATGLAIGVFIACVPLYGLQTVFCFFAARRFSLHPLPVIAGSQLSAPPFAPFLTFASVFLGHAVVTGKLNGMPGWHEMHWAKLSMATVNSFVVYVLLGGVLLGLTLGAIAFAAARVVMHFGFNRDRSAR